MRPSPLPSELSELVQRIKALSISDRHLLLDELVISIESEGADDPEAVAKAWEDEIRRRIEAADRGEVKWVPAEEAFARLGKRLGQKD